MANSTTGPEMSSDLAKAALKSVVGGMGFAFVLLLLWLVIIWLNGTQPLPPP